MFLVWSSLYAMVAVTRERQRAELETLRLAHELQAAKLAGLQAQLNPHFLFNALNTVRALIRIDQEAADDALLRVARILRYTLAADAPLVPLARELANARDYLALEQLRFEERLRVECDVAAEVHDVPIPSMLLQGLVENGVKHGIAQLPEGGVLRLRAQRVGTEVALEVESPCPPVAPSAPPGTGIGLANSAERLRLLFGDRARLVLDRDTPGRVVARVWIPSAS